MTTSGLDRLFREDARKQYPEIAAYLRQQAGQPAGSQSR